MRKRIPKKHLALVRTRRNTLNPPTTKMTLHKDYYQITAIEIPKEGETHLVDKTSVLSFTYDTALEAMAYVNSVRKYKTLVIIREIAVFNDCTQFNYEIKEEKLIEKMEKEIETLKENLKSNEG